MSNPNMMGDPQRQALISAGAHMLGGQYSRMPQTTFGNIGQAVNAGQNAYQNAMILQQAQAKQEADRMAAMAVQRRQLQQQTALQNYVDNLDVSPEVKSALKLQAGLDPKKFAEGEVDRRATPEEGLDLFAGSSYTDDAVLLAKMSGATDDQLNTPEGAQMVQKMAERLRQMSNVNQQTPPSQVGINDALIGSDLEYLEGVSNAAFGGFSLKSRVNIARDLSQQIEAGGTGADIILGINTAMQNLGLPTLQGEDETAMQEGLVAVSNSIINELRKLNPKDPQFTKPDLMFYMEQVPALSRTPEGRKIIMKVLDAQADRAIEYGQILDDVRAQPGMTAGKAAKTFRERVKEREANLDSLFAQANKVTGQDETATAPADLPMVEAGNARVYATIEEGVASGDAEFIVNGIKYRN